MRAGPIASLVIGILTLGCELGGPPIGANRPPPSCGNGRCEIATETCSICPADCECCAIVDSSGLAEGDTQAAAGKPDNSGVNITQNADLFLAFGREIFDNPTQGETDFVIHGTVTSSDQDFKGECPSAAVGRGAFEVWVSLDAADWRLVGLWTSKTTEFDVGCASLAGGVRWVRIKGQAQAQGQLDAITAKQGACLEAQAASSSSP